MHRVLLLVLSLLPALCFAHQAGTPDNEAEEAIKTFRYPSNLKVTLWGAEPYVKHPVAFCQDEKGRFFIVETHRFADGNRGGADRDRGGFDLRSRMEWYDQDMACRTVEDRLVMQIKGMGEHIRTLGMNSEIVRLVEDKNGDGKPDYTEVFSDGYNGIADGVAAGVLARKGKVWFTNIPHLWQLEDKDGDGKAEIKKSVHYGFGVRIAFMGHDLHGLIIGPDGKLYFSIGDRGSHVKAEGKTWAYPDTGTVFRCNQDGSDFEVIAQGMRNPQELAFDQYGNLFAADNNADKGDPIRWVWVLEGGDSGWRIGYQQIVVPNLLGPWHSEKLWSTHFDGMAAWVLPPIAHIGGGGPSGIAYYPGTGMPAEYNNTFLMCDFRGVRSAIYACQMQPHGAYFKAVNVREFWGGIQATDVLFGTDGGCYASLWYGGINHTQKGRIYRAFNDAALADPIVAETKKLLADIENYGSRDVNDLAKLLAHPDMRIRQEAQFALVDKGDKAVPIFAGILKGDTGQLAKLHAIWGLGQLARELKNNGLLKPVIDTFASSDIEQRAQAAKVCGDARAKNSFDGLIRLLQDANLRVRLHAAMSLGKIGDSRALPAIADLLRENDNRDPYLRHGGAMAFTWICRKEPQTLADFARDSSAGVRMAAVLALRNLKAPEIGRFVPDSDPKIAVEAARAINDVPIEGAYPALAEVLRADNWDRFALCNLFTIEHYYNIPGKNVSDLTSHPSFPDKPTERTQHKTLEVLDRPGNSGTRITGFIMPLLDGPYTFYVAADDSAEIWLSSDENPANKRLICFTREKVTPRERTKFPEQKSELIELQTGKRYYIEALYKKAEGRGHFSVAWNLPNDKLQWPVSELGCDDRKAMLRRALNANFRLGTSSNAKTIAGFAARNDIDPELRVEALTHLGNWEKPPERDGVMNLWRPLPARDVKPAVDVSRSLVTDLLRKAPREVRTAAAELAGTLKLKKAAPLLHAIANGEKEPLETRLEALQALYALDDEKLLETVRTALKDKEGRIRQRALQILAKTKPADAMPLLADTLEHAAVPEKQNAFAILGRMDGSEADSILGQWLDQFLAGKAAPEIQLDILDACEKRKSPALKDKLAQYQKSLPEDDEAAAYKVALHGGNADAGRNIFYNHVAAQCTRCHKMNGQGGDVGPELKGLAAKKDRAYILDSLVAPSTQIAEGFETVILTMNDGQRNTGIFKKEDDKSVTLMDANAKANVYQKSEIRSRKNIKQSTMPPMVGVLTRNEVRHLVEYLFSMK